MSEQLKNILMWGALCACAVLAFITVYNAVADEAADAERDTHAPYLTRVISHIIRHPVVPVQNMAPAPETVPAVR